MFMWGDGDSGKLYILRVEAAPPIPDIKANGSDDPLFVAPGENVNITVSLDPGYLIRAYRRLANSANRPLMENSPYFRDMEPAIADIQLFGTKRDIELVYSFLTEFDQRGQATLDPLLLELRNRLRDELGYEEVAENVRWFRPEGSPDINAQPLNAPDP